MFPPAPPNNFEMRPGSTSDFFKQEERAFFAQAGKEIVRVRFEDNFSHGNDPHPATRLAPRVSVPASVNTSPMFPPPASILLPSNLHSPGLQPTTSGLRTPPEDTTPLSSSKPEYTEEYDPNEAWRRPMPYAERRRAGKHTRRVIVRS
jgi:hypothetical protein